jgi:hypothetical protein
MRRMPLNQKDTLIARLKNVNYGVTHGGYAHFDDYLTFGLLTALSGHHFPLFRREPTQGELNDPYVVVFDVGGKHNPDLLNWDHHQLTVTEEHPDCSYSLLLKDMGMWDEFCDIHNWALPKVIMDCLGPRPFARSVGLTPRMGSVLSTFSPLEELALKNLERIKGSIPGDCPQARELGITVLEKVRVLRPAIENARKTVITYSTRGVKIAAWSQDEGMDPDITGKVARDLGAGITVTKDTRRSGWTLFRIDDHPRVCFLGLTSVPDIVFSHTEGYMAKTSDLDFQSAVKLARLGVLPEEVTA